MFDARAEQDGMLRVVDESGEDYLYPARLFVPLSVPEGAEKGVQRCRVAPCPNSTAPTSCQVLRPVAAARVALILVARS